MDITEFLLARIESDEAAWAEGSRLQTKFEFAKFSRHMLTECAAKRAIVEEHTCGCPNPDCGDCGACSGDHHADPTPAPCPTLRHLAAVYADHPDFDEAWRV